MYVNGDGDGDKMTCVVTDGDGNRFGWRRSGTDSKFTGTDGAWEGDK